MRTDEPVIQVQGLVNRFGKQAVHVNLDLDIRRGEILGVVGGSGTGKSVLLRSIVGLRRPNAGSVKVFGENLLKLSTQRRSEVERRFGVLFQRGALFTSLNLQENVALPLIEHIGLKRADAEHLAETQQGLLQHGQLQAIGDRDALFVGLDQAGFAQHVEMRRHGRA